MDSLHAPWRIEYVLSEKAPPASGSLFLDIANSSDDEFHLVIARDTQCFALLNRYPYNGGHVLVVPYRCVAEFEELTDDEMLAMMRLARRCVAGRDVGEHADVVDQAAAGAVEGDDGFAERGFFRGEIEPGDGAPFGFFAHEAGDETRGMCIVVARGKSKIVSAIAIEIACYKLTKWLFFVPERRN